MDLHWLKPLLGRTSPFVTVFLDATRAESAGESEAADRWKAARRELEREGAPGAVLDEIADLVAVPTGVRGPHGRVIVADGQGVLVDRVVGEPPARTIATFGPVPDLLPAVRAADEAVELLVVAVDRTGADLVWKSAGGARPGVGEDGEPLHESVEGGHDDVHKTRENGLSRRNQSRAEDSWQRNAEEVAAFLDKRVAERTPELVVLTGDVRAVALVCEKVGQQVRELVVEVPGGARGAGAKPDAFAQRVRAAVDELRARRRHAVLDRFGQALGRGEAAVTSLDDVVEVLRRGQVAELVLGDGALGALQEREVLVGLQPLELATNQADLDTLGVADGRRYPAVVALVRAALAQDAGVTFAPDGAAELADGVGALLRWSDESTPSEQLLTQSADARRVRAIP
ncbi:baeRF2 domain-containing protein [Cellulomonas sp. CW35]|uniref:Peptide chain release factor 1 n=1 Tax=Cellulomonas uda TaxID=1714 RepID=A0A4Y3KAT6_CELUD|nr:hypothetical protein [Cellulomonas uda]NII67028.1 hypothetical protein [Cellulomonas uda]GEA80098.1 hypothetical protein CUD01_05420 [Cellulomonas uda]